MSNQEGFRVVAAHKDALVPCALCPPAGHHGCAPACQAGSLQKCRVARSRSGRKGSPQAAHHPPRANCCMHAYTVAAAGACCPTPPCTPSPTPPHPHLPIQPSPVPPPTPTPTAARPGAAEAEGHCGAGGHQAPGQRGGTRELQGKGQGRLRWQEWWWSDGGGGGALPRCTAGVALVPDSGRQRGWQWQRQSQIQRHTSWASGTS